MLHLVYLYPRSIHLPMPKNKNKKNNPTMKLLYQLMFFTKHFKKQ